MRTIERWNEKVRDEFIDQFTPRIQLDLRRIPEPELPEEVKSNFIYAPTGFGKTLYACWLMLREQRNLYLAGTTADCTFISVPNLFQKIKTTFNTIQTEKESTLIDFYSNVHLLVLDDLGVNGASDWVLNTLYLIINNRYENMKKTIITSNHSLEQLAKIFGDDRITSRIQRIGEVSMKLNWK